MVTGVWKTMCCRHFLLDCSASCFPWESCKETFVGLYSLFCIIEFLQSMARVASWCQASRTRGYGMVFCSTGCNAFTWAGRVQNYSGCSWTYWIAHMTFQDFVLVPRRHKSLHVPFFFAVCLTVLQLESWHRTFTNRILRKKIYQMRDYDLGVQFPPLGLHFSKR